MATFAEFKTAVINLLGDELVAGPPIEGSNTPADVLKESCHAALVALSSRYWKTAVYTIPSSDSDLDIPVPADFIDVEAMYDTKLNIIIPKLFFQVGDAAGSSSGNSWLDYPNGTLAFENPIAEGGKLYYSAYWQAPSAESDVIEPPAIAYHFLQLFAVSYCLMRQANQQGLIKQFATKVDSGSPLTIPAQYLSDFFAKRAESELQRIPMKQRGVR